MNCRENSAAGLRTFNLHNPLSIKKPFTFLQFSKETFYCYHWSNTLFHKDFVLQLSGYLAGLSSEGLKTHQLNNLRQWNNSRVLDFNALFSRRGNESLSIHSAVSKSECQNIYILTQDSLPTEVDLRHYKPTLAVWGHSEESATHLWGPKHLLSWPIP